MIILVEEPALKFYFSAWLHSEDVSDYIITLANYHIIKLLFIFSHSQIGNMWQEQNNALYRKFEFKNFSEAFAFMTRVALVAEKMDHHPKWTNVWNTVELWLNTHDAGDIVTEKDRKLANAIDKLC